VNLGLKGRALEMGTLERSGHFGEIRALVGHNVGTHLVKGVIKDI